MRCTVRTTDGRLLAVEEQGDPAGWPVLVHHGTPSSRQAAFYRPWVRDAAGRGLRLISYDRPGYGAPRPTRAAPPPTPPPTSARSAPNWESTAW
ncbi:hypothetical protein Psuf_070620 [Phytohabitans suffuscus]|uniref:AB hydrolase-1 domain-containing protein n=1 Tax=Phytohabitans suffuscus TaxID=624315 RepID=A0A6F8YUJ9_9ACTN|nr:alpha/beta hydrolase [Phytohabitans suffuscus]BCB89749.1 hypothetical protein Psuf_070620 [Phytohabitans suffuscus]